MQTAVAEKATERLITHRAEFPKSVKAAAFRRDGGRCVDCDVRLIPSNTEYDHDLPCGLGGDNSLENCKCRCTSCHKVKTKGDVAAIAKTKRIYNKANGIQTRKHKQSIPSRTFPGSKASRFKKKLDGSVEHRKGGDQ